MLKILDGAVDWLAGRGTDQWQGARWRAEELSPDLATGGLRVAEIRPDVPPATSASPPGSFRTDATGVGAASATGAPPPGSLGAEALGAAGAPGPVAVGTMVLRDTHPADLWQPADDPGSALHLHHLAVDRASAGRRIGAWLLDQAAAEAARRGKQFLRLDAWTTNTRLHDYYRGQGFRLVRIADDTSGALFERPVSPP